MLGHIKAIQNKQHKLYQVKEGKENDRTYHSYQRLGNSKLGDRMVILNLYKVLIQTQLTNTEQKEGNQMGAALVIIGGIYVTGLAVSIYRMCA